MVYQDGAFLRSRASFFTGIMNAHVSNIARTCYFEVSFEDILVSFSLQRLNCILDHCSYVHGLALLLLC